VATTPAPETRAAPIWTLPPPGPPSGFSPDLLVNLYKQLNPGVVSIQVHIERGPISGSAAGSGFILDNAGHIVTNNHVVAGATQVTVIFYNAIEAEARIVGTDDDSDLAVIQVDRLAEGAHPLPLGDSDQVQVGEWVVAIGNPFGLSGSMTVGIVSAVGRMIPSETPFTIPQAIQTDAAINPGNSGGPLLNLRGEVIGVNAQIATGGSPASAGVGFAIPSNVVRLVVPALIERGAYDWPWLGIQGTSVNLFIMRANRLETQQGAYIDSVIQGSPADRAGLRGSTGSRVVNGLEVPVGGDVIIEADGRPIRDFSDLLVAVAFKRPGDPLTLTILREGQRQGVTVTLAPRPQRLGR
jgi:2-alkenal reductase